MGATGGLTASVNRGGVNNTAEQASSGTRRVVQHITMDHYMPAGDQLSVLVRSLIDDYGVALS